MINQMPGTVLVTRKKLGYGEAERAALIVKGAEGKRPIDRYANRDF